MELAGFTPNGGVDSDTLKASDAVETPLIVVVRGHKTGIVTQFKPDGADVIECDVVKIATDSTFIGVGWFNAGIVNDLKGHVGKALPIKLVYKQTKSGRAAIVPVALEGAELEAAAKWASANGDRLDRERAERFGGGSSAPQTAPAAHAAAAPAGGAQQDAEIAALRAQLGITG
ncbi:hypothetical protein [Saccharopolyspora shandongensis]|uniref:hypothetical protein n=1 Tax=Saccharopolyspora shandongensis TaxID=418495 RepID=UPI0033CF378E